MAETEYQQPESSQALDSLTFEEAFDRLNEMAASLEQGGLTLAEATSRYEQSMILIRRCNQLLDQTELKITTLKDSYESDLAPGAGGSSFDLDEAGGLDQRGDFEESGEGSEDGESPDSSPTLF